jgi:hypothetical protein
MKNRPRPYISFATRVKVARRQLSELPRALWRDQEQEEGETLTMYLHALLGWLKSALGCDELQLDHDPALILRKLNRRTGKYTPDANDPDYLVYRPKDEHQQKTTGRKPGAERTVTTKGSDIWLKTKFKKLENPTKKRARKIPSRPFPSSKQRG